MVVDHHLNVPHDFRIPPVCLLGHDRNAGIVPRHARWLRVEDKRHSKEPLDPFCPNDSKGTQISKALILHMRRAVGKQVHTQHTDELIAPMSLESILSHSARTARRTDREHFSLTLDAVSGCHIGQTGS